MALFGNLKTRLRNFWTNRKWTVIFSLIFAVELIIIYENWDPTWFTSDNTTTTTVTKKHTEKDKPNIHLKIKTPPLTPAGQQAVDELTKQIKALNERIDRLLSSNAKADSTKKASAPMHARVHHRTYHNGYAAHYRPECNCPAPKRSSHMFDQKQY